jgi:hypothetical protein
MLVSWSEIVFAIFGNHRYFEIMFDLLPGNEQSWSARGARQHMVGHKK